MEVCAIRKLGGGGSTDGWESTYRGVPGSGGDRLRARFDMRCFGWSGSRALEKRRRKRARCPVVNWKGGSRDHFFPVVGERWQSVRIGGARYCGIRSEGRG